MNWRRASLLALALGALLVHGPAHGQSSDLEFCENGSGERAVEACSALISSRKLNDEQLTAAYRLRGVHWRGLGNFRRAIDDQSEALRIRPNYAPAWNSRCWARGTGGIELEEALIDCNEAIKLSPGYFHYHNSRGLILLRLGRIDDAILDFTSA